MSGASGRWRAIGGIAGPITFVTTWSALSLATPGYSPVHEPISRLAAVEASSRSVMTGGFVVFGVGVALYAREISRCLSGAAGAAAAATAAATVGIAVTPLGSALGGAPHAACAGVAYAALASTPALGARAFARRGDRGAAVISTVVAVASGASLLASAVAGTRVGLLQRLGLTLGDAWIVASAVWLVRGVGRPRPFRRGGGPRRPAPRPM
jgi:hypothetical membrane protein